MLSIEFFIPPPYLYPFARAHVLRSTVMDLFFGWTATALATYLAGYDLFENGTPTNDVTNVSSQGVSVSWLVPLTTESKSD